MQPRLTLPFPHPLDPFQLKAEVFKDGGEQLVAGQRVFVELAVADDVSQARPFAADCGDPGGVVVHVVEVFHDVVGHQVAVEWMPCRCGSGGSLITRFWE
jgi:hypothetical protein